MTDLCNIQVIQRQFVKYVEQGTLHAEVCQSLLNDGKFLSKEGWLWDYKTDGPTDKYSRCKWVRNISAFYNSYGGYIVVGVKESIRDREFLPTGKVEHPVSVSEMRNLCKEYLSGIIDFSLCDFTLEIYGKVSEFQLLYVPKRMYGEDPVVIRKKGPENSKNVPLFVPDVAYFRRLDECLPAKKAEDHQFILGRRTDPVSWSGDGFTISSNETVLEHNLPDKNQICPKFYGRSQEISTLWAWFTNPFEYTKLLAGDGGKGKTSIALEFCTQFAKNPPESYERILWLSAKTKQFSPMHDQYIELGIGDFSDAESLLLSLCKQCSYTSEELAGISFLQLTAFAKKALRSFPSLIVVDDVDSLEEEEQQKVVEACRSIGEKSTKVLITSRKSVLASSESCIVVPGLQYEEFSEYVGYILGQYDLAKKKKAEIESLYRAVDGSPLLAQSIIRIHNMGEPWQRSIYMWKGKLGEDARNAALRREIEQVSTAGKKVLVALSVLSVSSATELKQVVNMGDVEFMDAISELRKLFLVSEPQITPDEKRYGLSVTCSLIVKADGPELIVDYNAVCRNAKSARANKKYSTAKGNKKRTNDVIFQASALQREGKIQNAIATLDSELARQKNEPILLSIKAKCLMNMPEPNFDLARRLFCLAVKEGNNHPTTFEHWFRAEKEMDSLSGMLECASRALECEERGVDIPRWYYIRAMCLRKRWEIRTAIDDHTDLLEASIALGETLKLTKTIHGRKILNEFYELSDFLWSLVKEKTGSWFSNFKIIERLILNGDRRGVMYERAKNCLLRLRHEPLTLKAVDGYEINLKSLERMIEQRPYKEKRDLPLVGLTDDLYPIPNYVDEGGLMA